MPLPAPTSPEPSSDVELTGSEAPDPKRSWPLLRLGLLILATAALAVGIVRHVPVLAGPRYASWGWHPSRPIAIPFLLSALIFAAGVVIAELSRRKNPIPAGDSSRSHLLPMLLLMLGCLGFVITSAPGIAEEGTLQPTLKLIESPMAISYFADAAALHQGGGDLRDWLANYPQLLPQMYLHSREKPPGPVLFFAIFIHFFGVTDRAALVSAIAILLLLPLGIPAVCFFARQLGATPRQAFHAGACTALFPSLIRFYPSLDGLWLVGTALALGFWARGLRRNSMLASGIFGAALALLLFCVYNVLVIGALVVGYGFAIPPRGTRLMRFIRHSAVAIAVLIALYLLLAVVSGFNPIATFSAALENQAQLARSWNRPYPLTIPFDLSDFLLGVGWLAGMLAIFALIPWTKRGHSSRSEGELSSLILLLGLLEIVLVAVTGLLPAETARVWAFLAPLVAIPAGVELSRWRVSARAVGYTCMLLILALICANLLSAESHLLG
jgi:hypothetical protein